MSESRPSTDEQVNALIAELGGIRRVRGLIRLVARKTLDEKLGVDLADAEQEVLVRVVEAVARGRGPERRPFAWMWSTAVNTLRSIRRRRSSARRRELALRDLPRPDDLDGDRHSLESVDVARIELALDRVLSGRQQRILAARLDGRLGAEIARDLEISPSLVSREWRRIADTIRRLLADEPDPPRNPGSGAAQKMGGSSPGKSRGAGRSGPDLGVARRSERSSPDAGRHRPTVGISDRSRWCSSAGGWSASWSWIFGSANEVTVDRGELGWGR